MHHSAHQWGVRKRREDSGACLPATTRERARERDRAGMFDLWVKVQEEMLPVPLLSFLPLPTPPSCLQCLGAVGRVPFLPPPPPSESSLQEIKGFKRRSRVSYGALWPFWDSRKWLKSQTGFDWANTGNHNCVAFVKEKLSLRWRRMRAIGRMLDSRSLELNSLLTTVFCHEESWLTPLFVRSN